MSALFVAWRGADPDKCGWGPVGRLQFDRGVYRFWYTRGALTLDGFRPFSQMDDINQVYESETLFPIFANRLLSASRPEYEDFLRWGGFDPDDPPNPIAVLGVTEGIRQTDAIEVFSCPVPDSNSCYINKFFLHGLRLVPQNAQTRVQRLSKGDLLLMEEEPTNQYDPNAVAVFTSDDRVQIGYVPRYLTHDAGHLLRECEPEYVQLFVERVNSDAPLQHRLLCKMQACWPAGFEPCSGEAFQPIPRDVTSKCES